MQFPSGEARGWAWGVLRSLQDTRAPPPHWPSVRPGLALLLLLFTAGTARTKATPSGVSEPQRDERVSWPSGDRGQGGCPDRGRPLTSSWPFPKEEGALLVDSGRERPPQGDQNLGLRS